MMTMMKSQLKTLITTYYKVSSCCLAGLMALLHEVE